MFFPIFDHSEVVLAPKQNGSRSQLWRMDAKGQIIHEGSGPPRDPRKPGTTNSEPAEENKRCYVLDIADTAVQVGTL